jgi:hypothetical protein
VRLIKMIFCCGARDREHMIERLQLEDAQYHNVRDPCARPLQDVAEDSALLPNRRAGDTASMRKMSPQLAQEAHFKSMKKPSFTTVNRSGSQSACAPGAEEEVCLICLEEFTDANPKVFYECSHGVNPYHLLNATVPSLADILSAWYRCFPSSGEVDQMPETRRIHGMLLKWCIHICRVSPGLHA